MHPNAESPKPDEIAEACYAVADVYQVMMCTGALPENAWIFIRAIEHWDRPGTSVWAVISGPN